MCGVCVCVFLLMQFHLYSNIHTRTHTLIPHIHSYAQTHTHIPHTYMHTHIHKHTYTHINIHTYTYIHAYIDVSVAEWLAWLSSNFGRIGATGSSHRFELVRPKRI